MLIIIHLVFDYYISNMIMQLIVMIGLTYPLILNKYIIIMVDSVHNKKYQIHRSQYSVEQFYDSIDSFMNYENRRKYT